MRVIKNIIFELAEPVAHICNLSLSTGQFPDEMNIAKVVPLYKDKEVKDFNNYRPVSFLAQFAKVLEKLINNRITKFIQDNNLLTDVQYKFRSNHSTALALADLTEVISKTLDEGN